MEPALKLNAIDQEHLQEVYDASGVARDELPYTEAFETLWQEFDDRTFKHASREQVYAALLKYVRSSSNPPGPMPEGELSDEQTRQIRTLIARHGQGGKMLPYSEEFESAREEFNQSSQHPLGDREFWEAILRVQSARRRPPRRPRKTAVSRQSPQEE